MLNRIVQLTGADVRKPDATSTSAPSIARVVSAATTSAALATAPPIETAGSVDASEEFIPVDPSSIHDAGLTDSEVEALILKYLLSRGDSTGRDVSEQVKLSFILLDPLLRQLKLDQLLVYRGSAPMNDYIYQLTDLGLRRRLQAKLADIALRFTIGLGRQRDSGGAAGAAALGLQIC